MVAPVNDYTSRPKSGKIIYSYSLLIENNYHYQYISDLEKFQLFLEKYNSKPFYLYIDAYPIHLIEYSRN